jgi:Flagellar transcriptional activator (FlhC)
MCVGNHDRLRALVGGPEREARILDTIEVVTQARRTLEAVHLVQLGARGSLVCQLTGLTKKVVSRLYPTLTGMPSPPGQVPFTDTWYLRSNQRMLHANVVWRLYQHLEQSGCSTARVLIYVYETYTQIMDAPLLTLTRAFFVPRLIAINAWYEQACDHCGMSYIGPLGNDGSTCPACAEYFKYRCRSCGTAIEYHPAGRWKAVCSSCYEQQKRSKKRLTGGVADGYPEV